MAKIKVKTSKIIAASAQEIYEIIANYKTSHPKILPKPYFKELKVLKGGIGAGTVFEVEMEVMGIKSAFHMIVSEPEPGRIITEKDEEQEVETSFILDPENEGTKVSIITESTASSGLKGLMERLFNPMIIKRIFKEELNLLAAEVKN